VIRVDASPVAAEVVEFHPLWHRANKELVAVSVSADVTVAGGAEVPVPIGRLWAGPLPTVTGRVNVPPEPDLGRVPLYLGVRVSVLLNSLIVFTAVPPP